jgi:hypothetical protein
MTEHREITCKLQLLREFHIMSILIKYLYPCWLPVKIQNSGSTWGYHFLRSDLFMALNIQIAVFLDVTQCSLTYEYQYQNIGTYIPDYLVHIPEDCNLNFYLVCNKVPKFTFQHTFL